MGNIWWLLATSLTRQNLGARIAPQGCIDEGSWNMTIYLLYLTTYDIPTHLILPIPDTITTGSSSRNMTIYSWLVTIWYIWLIYPTIWQRSAVGLETWIWPRCKRCRMCLMRLQEWQLESLSKACWIASAAKWWKMFLIWLQGWDKAVVWIDMERNKQWQQSNKKLQKS